MSEKRSPEALERRREWRKQYRRTWRQTPEGKYASQKYVAKTRGVAWEFTFETWLAEWGDKLPHRGRTGDDLVMARRGDAGPYAPGNVEIIAKRQNDRDRERNRQRASA